MRRRFVYDQNGRREVTNLPRVKLTCRAVSPLDQNAQLLRGYRRLEERGVLRRKGSYSPQLIKKLAGA